MCYAYAMEPYTTVASWGEGELTVWTSGQHPFMVRDDLAHCFGLPLSKVRVIVPYVGGGYGSKSYTKIEPLTAALALRAGRPVRLGPERRGGDPDDAGGRARSSASGPRSI